MSTSSGPVTVPATTSAVTLLAANPKRSNAAIYNGGTGTLYVSLGTTVSSSVFTIAMVAGSYYELPNGGNSGVYSGVITGVWSATGGTGANVTELT